MTKKAFLMNFKQEVPFVEATEEFLDVEYSEERQMNILADGELAWNARTRSSD
jgi:hypothetical protein